MRRMLVIAPILIGAFFILTSNALANSSTAAWRGWCGGPASTQSTLLAHWKSYGVVGQSSDKLRSAGYNPMDIGLSQWMSERVVHVRTARASVTRNYGCKQGVLIPVGMKTLPAGHPVFATLPSWLSKGKFSLRRTGWFNKALLVTGHIVADAGCSNVHQGIVVYIVYVHVAVKVVHRPLPGQRPVRKPAPRPAPQPAPQGNCNVNVTNSTNVTVVNCSTVVVWVQCGIIQIPFQRNTVEESVNAANQYVAAHVECSPPSPPVTVPPGTTPQPPPCNNCGGHQPPPPCNDTSCQPCSGSSCQPCPNGTDQNGNCKKGDAGSDPNPGNPGPGTTPPGGNPGSKGDPPPAGCNPQTDPNHCTGVDPTP